MKLLRLRADGFGLLRGEWAFDPHRVSIVIDENERGKTSLLHAISAALYGLDADARRHRLVTPLERWRPWDGGPYRVELELESRDERYLIARDFSRGTVSVWNGRGQDVAGDFREGRDEYPVGLRLLGLDADEFEKCALWRQGELDQVVPEQERDRRVSTLRARLENAADTRAGDTSAAEAIQALRAAADRYASPSLQAPIKVENTITRLQGLRDALETELRALEHEYRAVAGPVEELATLAEEERLVRERLGGMDARLVRLRAADAHARLARDDAHRGEVEALLAEARTLEHAANVPEDAESLLRTQAARHEDARRALEIATARRDRARADRDRLVAEIGALDDCASATAEDADQLAAAAARLSSMGTEDLRLREDLAAAEQGLIRRGFEPERAQALVGRFEGLAPEVELLLRDQPRFALMQQAEMATAEQSRAVGRETLRVISAWKRPRFVAGALLLVLGGAAAATPFLYPLLAPLLPFAIGGGAAALAGLVVLIATAMARGKSRESAAERIVLAEDQIRQVHVRNTENETRLAALAASMGCEGAGSLLRDWGDHQVLRDLMAPLHAIRDQVSALDGRRAGMLESIAGPLDRSGGAAPSTAHLEAAAARIRRRLELGRGLAEAERVLASHEEAIAEASKAVLAMEEAAVAAIASAGLAYDRHGAWSSWIDVVAARVREGQRHQMIVRQFVPNLERNLLDDGTRESLRAEIARGEAHAAAAGAETAASPAELEQEVAALHRRRDEIQRRREELRLNVEGVTRRYHEQHAPKSASLAALDRELARAMRFRESVTLARETLEKVASETHKRWAEFLTERVGALLASVGSSVGRVRFGEDLDFAVGLGDGSLLSRGKALHQLSSGARDQLHLCVRLAISEYLSRGGDPVPLLIDDCFSTSDDERARAGMRLLLENFSQQHQIVLVTCHRQRYRALATLDPELYEHRVQWVDLRPIVAAGGR